MKKNFKAFEPITNEELNEIAGGSAVPPVSPQIPTISVSICLTTKCMITTKNC
ncbi:bacteriocin [Lysinibacillus xylanilyticus]|uniref:Bacteriocin n=1 Tax=Lysinibacillus xylanilyticus TaxID=582475 RepID=A0ABT4ERP0_9BACI|nr:bacteriocin [Lysinibacillus xylanilyticus]MCY9548335.1 bacteriocin [Lysinibacillus xylanilyticus]